jgi:FkbM family methyltransferase
LSISATHLHKEGYTNGLSDMLNHNHPNNIRSNRKPILTEIKVKVRRLTDIFSEANINTIDILSIDVEGHELEVINGINFELYKPKVIVIENFGRSEKYVNHMKSVGYKLDFEVEYNQIYIPS